MDAATMVPGIVVSHYLAWKSDDFVYRVAVLSWVWCCMCSIIYHLSKCNSKLKYYDLRSQWVSQAFMILETPQHSYPIILGGILPVNYTGRLILNGIGGFYFVHHNRMSAFILTLAYIVYFAQFPTRMKWGHSVFHLLLNWSGTMVALSPVKKYTLPWVHPGFAWVVYVVGMILLLPSFKTQSHLTDPVNTEIQPHSELGTALESCLHRTPRTSEYQESVQSVQHPDLHRGIQTSTTWHQRDP